MGHPVLLEGSGNVRIIRGLLRADQLYVRPSTIVQLFIPVIARFVISRNGGGTGACGHCRRHRRPIRVRGALDRLIPPVEGGIRRKRTSPLLSLRSALRIGPPASLTLRARSSAADSVGTAGTLLASIGQDNLPSLLRRLYGAQRHVPRRRREGVGFDHRFESSSSDR